MAPYITRSPRNASNLITLIGLSAVLLALPGLAGAQHRAELSRGLARQIESGASQVNVIYEGPQDEVDRLATRYGVRIAKRWPGGAVLAGNSQQIDTLAGDSGVASLSADEVVMGTSLAAQSTGASQLFRSFGRPGNFTGLVGRGIGVAVIDSGIAAHGDLANRIL